VHREHRGDPDRGALAVQVGAGAQVCSTPRARCAALSSSRSAAIGDLGMEIDRGAIGGDLVLELRGGGDPW